MATDPGLTYVKRPSCEAHGRPDLAPTSEMVTEAAQTWTCPVDGRTWTTVVQYGTGAQCNTIWQSTAAPGKLSPLGQRVATLETQNVTTSDLRATQQAAIDALTARTTALEAKTYSVTERNARAAIPTLAVNAKADVVTTWSTPFPDAIYQCDASLPSALLGKATVAFKSKTPAAATWTVTATVTVALGQDLLATAVRYA